MKREEKAQLISELHENFTKAKAVIFTDFSGLKVEEINNLRRRMKASSLDYMVIKNTLARRASEGTGLEIVKDKFKGPLGIAISLNDALAVTKSLKEYLKEKVKLKIKFGVIEGRFVEPDEIRAIADLPAKEVMLSSLLSGLQSPTRKLAGLLYQLVARFGYALEAVKNKKQQ